PGEAAVADRWPHARGIGKTRLARGAVQALAASQPVGWVDLGVWAAVICRAQAIDQLPQRRGRFFVSAASRDHGSAGRPLRASLGPAARVDFPHLAALTLP
ncbi:MAG: hypothetical protein ACSLEZ_13245, partial [Thiobacillus sp.]